MPRRLLTKGSVAFIQRLLNSFEIQVTSNWSNEIRASATEVLNKIATSKSEMINLKRLGLIEDGPEKHVLEEDHTAHMTANNGWESIVSEDMIDCLGRYGDDAISCLGEAVLVTNALAKAFHARRVFYRGEQKYGWALTSRAERNMEEISDEACGITEREISETLRFQEDVRSSPVLLNEIFGDSDFYKTSDPRWLPIMQHYDEVFGTRLLDLTSSIYAGMYFACIGWNGMIDTANDGLLYVFFDISSQWRGNYYDDKTTVTTEFDDVIPEALVDSFRDWKYPEYFRLYQSSFSSPRELSQDGYFLVKGSLGTASNHGQGFKFRIPAEQKLRIAKELWFAGYTPERMIRGDKGVDARTRLAAILGMPT